MVLKPLDLALAYVLHCEFEHGPEQEHRTAEFKGEVLRLVAEEFLQVSPRLPLTMSEHPGYLGWLIPCQLRPRPSTYHELKTRLDDIYNIPLWERDRWVSHDGPSTGVVNPLVRFVSYKCSRNESMPDSQVHQFVESGTAAIRQTGFENFMRVLIQVETEFEDTDRDNSLIVRVFY